MPRKIENYGHYLSAHEVNKKRSLSTDKNNILESHGVASLFFPTSTELKCY